MYRIWYWAMIERESDGRFIASIPDLGDLAVACPLHRCQSVSHSPAGLASPWADRSAA